MATIALNGTSINFGMGIFAFDSLGTAFSSAKKTTGGLQKAIGNLITKIDIAKTAAKVETAQTEAKNAKTREETKESSLTLAYDKLDTLINDVGTVDNKVSTKVSAEKNDFYKKYEYLKPECEKSLKEKIKDGWNSFCDKVAEVVGGFVEWCKEHWKELLIGLVCIVIGALITVFTAGTGTAFWAAFVAAIGKGLLMAAITGVISGGVCAGVTYYKCKKAGMSSEMASKFAMKAFGDGFANGFMTGGIGYAVGAGTIGGVVKIFGKEALLSKSLLSAIGKGALFGAGTNAIVSPVSTAISYYLANGTLKGSGDQIIKSTITGVISGAIFGGITGGVQYKYAEYRISRIEESIAEKDITPFEKGNEYEAAMLNEYENRFPDSVHDSQCRLNSNNIINRQGNSSYTKPDLLVENGNGNFIDYDFKWNNATKSYNQNVLTAGGHYHVYDTVISHGHTVFSTNNVPAGVPFIEVHNGMFNSIFGVPINYHFITAGSLGIEAGLNTGN